MKIILTSVGTRGDMEPFLAIAELLKEKGHHVICAFPEQFKNLVEETGVEFASLGEQFIELLESEDGKAAMGGSTGTKKLMATIRLAQKQGPANKQLVKNQYEIIEREKPDRIIYNGKAVYPILWELENKGKTIFVSPLPFMHYVEGHTHIAFNSDFGTFFNKLSFSLAHFGMVTTTLMAKKWLNIKRKISRKSIRNILQFNRTIYTISPALFKRPDNWHENLQVLGYHERNKTINWQPTRELIDFLNKHEKVVLITFGSMTNTAPEAKTSMLLEILEKNKIPAIINTASGGLVEPSSYDRELIHFVSRTPYDWMFPRINAVIHHGGSGTTHMGLKYGLPTMIIPHIIDQFAWNNIVHKLGAGPKGIKINKINPGNLEPKILDLINNPSYKKKAEEIAREMKKEDFKEEIYKAITKG